MRNSIRKSLLFIVLSLLLPAGLCCGRYTYVMIYNRIDYLLYLDVEKYFAPDEKQREFVKQRLTALLEWNRETALPRYKEILIYMKSSEEKGITEANIDHIYNMFDREIETIADRVAPDAAEFVLTLNDEQIENFKNEVIKNRREEEKRHSSFSKDPIERRTQSTIRFLSRFFGRFSKEQTDEIKNYLLNNPYPDYDWREYQDIEQKRFVNIVNKGADKETAIKFIKNWLTGKDTSHADTYRERVLAQRKFNASLYVFVDRNIVTKEQRSSAVDTINKWIEAIDIIQSGK